MKIAVGLVVGLFVLDWAVLSPGIAYWKQQSERITELGEKVERGRQLIEREHSIQARWAEMVRTDLPEDPSSAESEVFKAIGRWASASRVSFTSLTPQWRAHEEGFDTYECRASATGDQASLGRLLYEIEVDPLPAHLQECEISTRDAQGKQLLLSVRFSFLRLTEGGKNAR
ncbi:MAG: hypothetical protein M3463_22840 [Verrucomicrobiota bacterium]|nr:hypothetical protein [Verrucomicrobiota bacterium]